MVKTTAAIIAGVVLGILATLAVTRFDPSSDQSADEVVRDIADVPKMALVTAEKHRDERYARLTSVEEVVALPTEFARADALHSLAGRSDSGGVQSLIFEANRIADDVERANLLSILFFRLAETDPQSALALARTDPFKAARSIERTVWRAWARKDLDDALFAAKTQVSEAHQRSAAQGLYAAFGFMGNETTEHIEAELGIGPDRFSRGRYLYQLADKSTAEAIAFINGLERGVEQQEYVSWLANYVSLQDPTAALRYADLFAVASDSKRYRTIINNNIARENPEATIDRLLASVQMQTSGEFQSAIRALASTDIDALKMYFEQARSSEARQMIGAAIASQLAEADPLEALTWARANEKQNAPYLQMSVLARIAETDWQFALAEARNMPNTRMRSNVISYVLGHVAKDDPADAVAILDQLEDPKQKLEAGQRLISNWIYQDPDAAIDWILAQDNETARELIQTSAHNLVSLNPDAAIKLLPRLDAKTQLSLRQQIAHELATQRSPGEAQAFIRQFEGQPGYARLQASVIAGVAEADITTAKLLADQLADSDARDRAYVQVIAQHAGNDPAEAARWLNSVNDAGQRGHAAGQLAARWYQIDPAEAVRWVNSLPAGSSRDDAIMRMSFQWRDATAEQDKLIASIKDRGKRSQAKMQQIQRVMQADSARARRLLEDEDIPADKREQIEAMISQYGSRF